MAERIAFSSLRRVPHVASTQGPTELSSGRELFLRLGRDARTSQEEPWAGKQIGMYIDVGMADQCGLGRTRADDWGKSQTLGADVGLLDAKLPFEHLPRPLAERELINLCFDRRLLAANYARHKLTVTDLSCVLPEPEGSCRYQAGRNAPLICHRLDSGPFEYRDSLWYVRVGHQQHGAIIDDAADMGRQDQRHAESLAGTT